jgi:Fis family transcriptional regulator
MGLSSIIRDSVNDYLNHCEIHDDLYNLVIEEVEKGLFEEVLKHCDGTQIRAAKILGMSLSTFRKRLKKYKII